MQKPPCWVIPRNQIPHYGTASFITGQAADDIMAALETKGRWEPRTKELEEDVSLRQVIPYVLIRNTKTDTYMVLERMKGQDEARLHGDICLGAGGHMEPVDKKSIEIAAHREIEEETGFTPDQIKGFKFVGIICVTDPAEPIVHHVHIGAVYEATTEEEKFGGETEKQNAKWMGPDEIEELIPRMEVWAREVTFGHLREYLNIVAVASA
jgi:predicted NUDIX family phosphoesterase